MPVDIPDDQTFGDLTVPPEPPAAHHPGLLPIPWTLRDLGLFLLFAPLALVLANLIVLTGHSILHTLLGWRDPISALPRNTFFLLALQLVFQGLLLSFVYVLVVVRHQRPFWSGLRWRKPSLSQTVWLTLGGIMLALAIQWAPSVLPETKEFPLQQMFTSPAAGCALGAYAILIAPWTEEVVFRGLLFGIFERQVGLWFAVVATALLFGGMHVPEYWGAWNHVLLISLVGLTFSLARGLTDSLAPSMILHLAYNTSLIAGLFVQTQGFQNVR
jgi:hypothetical protein